MHDEILNYFQQKTVSGGTQGGKLFQWVGVITVSGGKKSRDGTWRRNGKKSGRYPTRK